MSVTIHTTGATWPMAFYFNPVDKEIHMHCALSWTKWYQGGGQ